MNDEIVSNRSWLKVNRIWFITSVFAALLLIVILFLNFNNTRNLSDFATAYSDNALYENALMKVRSNKEASQILGKIEPIDKLSILEGTATYSNNYNSVQTTIRIKGNKSNAKMDISAVKQGTNWEYKKITVRIKKTDITITIIT